MLEQVKHQALEVAAVLSRVQQVVRAETTVRRVPPAVMVVQVDVA